VVTQFSENGIFYLKFRVFEKTIRQKVTENWFFFGVGVVTFMPTGYGFQSFLKKIRQLSRNLPKDTLPTSGNWKKNTTSSAATYIVSTLICTTTIISLEPCALNAEF